MKRFHEGVLVGDRYELTRFIASGGMGDVWEARDTTLDRVVALKIMRPDTTAEPVFAERFRDEALMTAGLSHHNIATLFDYGQHEEMAFLVMELVDGIPLSEVLRDSGALDPDRVRSIVGQMALALGAAHDAGLVHRDIKPANVLLTESGTVKLTDFGIARATDSGGRTRTGEMLGTPNYLSPEQALGRTATPASDIYALGVVAHELLSGRRPFDKETPVATALAHVMEPMPTLPAAIPTDLTELISRCLAKEPEDRPASAREVATAIGMPWVEVPQDAPPPPVEVPVGVQTTQEAKVVDVLVRPGARILDVGCGSGRLASSLHALGHQVVGVDSDKAALDQAILDHPDVTWVLSDLLEVTLDRLGVSVPFDVVALVGSRILDIPALDRELVFGALATLTAPNGRMVVELRRTDEYSYQQFRGDFIAGGWVPDAGFSGWDLRPDNADSPQSVVFLSRR